MIVVLFESLYPKEVSRRFGTFILLLFERLIFKLVIKTIDRRELRLRKFLWTGHVIIRKYSLAKNEVVVRTEITFSCVRICPCLPLEVGKRVGPEKSIGIGKSPGNATRLFRIANTSLH